MSEKRNLFVVSIDVKLLYERLIKTAIGEVVSYSELTSLIRLSVQSKAGRDKLYHARERAEKYDGMVFSAITNVGIQRCDDIQITASGPKAISKIRKTSKRGSRRLSLVKDYASMPPQERITHNASMAQLGMLHEMTKPAATKRIEAKVQQVGKTLALEDTLRVFKGEK